MRGGNKGLKGRYGVKKPEKVGRRGNKGGRRKGSVDGGLEVTMPGERASGSGGVMEMH